MENQKAGASNSDLESILNAFVTLIDSLKWPIVVIILFLIFSKQLKALINRISKFKLGDRVIEMHQSPSQKDQT